MKPFCLAVALLVAGGCSQKPIARTTYLMRAPEASVSGAVSSPATLGIRRLSVAPYLQNPGLVVETEPGRVRGARYHEWAEPLDQGARRYLRAELAERLGYDVDTNPTLAGQWTYAVDLGIDQLHGTSSGEALLVAAWRVANVRNEREVGRFRFVRRVPLAGDGYAALARAQLELLSALAAAIAESVPAAR